MNLGAIHQRVSASSHKPWQIYLLVIALSAGAGLYLDLWVMQSLLIEFERATAGWSWLAVLGIQGVLIGFVAELLYDQGDRYAKSLSDQFGTKDRTLVVRIGLMTLVSGVITKGVPPMLASVTEYLVVQTLGAIVVLGILLVHRESRAWNPWTEWPAIAAGAILAIGPSLV
jgi:hypothetical protein